MDNSVPPNDILPTPPEVGPGRYIFFVVMCLIVLGGMLVLSLRIPPPPPPPEIKADPILTRGYEVYMRQCVACHGLKGKADGPRALSMPVKPRNLVDEDWKYGEDDASVTRIIRDGGPEGVMPAFGKTLNEGEIRAIVKYVKQFKKRPGQEPTAAD